MYHKICIGCGKEYDTECKYQKYCDADCRKENADYQYFYEKGKYRAKYKPKTRYCLICGLPNPENNYQRYCTDCLLRMYKNKKTRSWAYGVLSCRGYDAREIKLKCEERGI